MDPVTLEVLRGYFLTTVEEMGIALRKSAYSPNIKERADHSCALFDEKGRMVAQAEHIPIHLAAMPSTMKLLIAKFNLYELRDGDALLVNDPYIGGTHLPDVTMITPVFFGEEILAFMASRAHQSDVGGMTPGSMAGSSTEVFQEGLRIPPVKIMKDGSFDRDLLNLILSNVRTPLERKGDLIAQASANILGAKRIKQLAEKYGRKIVVDAFEGVIAHAERVMRKELSMLPQGAFTAVDYLDNDGVEDENININVTVKTGNDTIKFDFSGTHRQVSGPMNAVESVTQGAVYYVVKTITDPTLPPNDGTFKPIEVYAPKGTLVNPEFPAAVAGGVVETSQRIVDVAYLALSKAVPHKIAAAAQGTMNNLALGGIDTKTEKAFSYYETIAGGMGARPNKDGVNAVHTHLTNTMNTPIEILENAYPITVINYEIRKNSGGAGMYKGGDGIRRELRIECDKATVTLLGDRQSLSPWGLNGGKPGKPGLYYVTRKNSVRVNLPSKESIRLQKGDVITIETPGGGGYGSEHPIQ